ncbi:MAG: alpha-glucosidase [Anaerolineaceae bacterium]|nr:alpha-glucosidase [Anaerolineaceae bacterium]
MPVTHSFKWWQKAVFYQIYPRSFADGNGDGIGDIPGIISRLDYLQDLGVDAIWLSPHYPSPQFDVGYDIADYTNVEPAYGTLADFKQLLEGLHQRGIRLILDLVLNHTSDQHGWFQESRSSRDNPKRDWYIWRDPQPDGSPPNNWDSTFGGSAWEFYPLTGQYYYHFFFKEQPDLNWRNPQVKQAMWDAIRFWLDMGVDGFRLDALGTIYEDPLLPNHTAGMSLVELQSAYIAAQNEEERRALGAQFDILHKYQIELPEVQDLMKELRSLVDQYPDRVLVGETSEIRYYGDGSNQLHMLFNFPLLEIEGPQTPAHVRKNQQQRIAAMPPGAWAANTSGNHDGPRVWDSWGDGKNNAARARLSLAEVLTLKGTPFLYNGEEIGMTNLILQDPALFRDNLSIYAYEKLIGLMRLPAEEALKMAVQYGRDRCRSPLQWRDAPNAGFCPQGVTPWLPVNPNYADGVNVADQEADPDSLLNFYKALLRLRKQNPALSEGDYVPLLEKSKDCLVFLRKIEGAQTVLVALNMSEKEHTLNLDAAGQFGRLLYSTRRRKSILDLKRVKLAPFEIFLTESI